MSSLSPAQGISDARRATISHSKMALFIENNNYSSKTNYIPRSVLSNTKMCKGCWSLEAPSPSLCVKYKKTQFPAGKKKQ